MTKEPTFTPAEVKKRLGLTTKALRLYGEKGLIAPARREGGWRVFRQTDLERLYEIRMLRNFGLSLDQIAQLLNARGKRQDVLASVLRLQSDTLRQELLRLNTAMDLIARAQKMVDAGKPVDTSDLVSLGELATLPQEDSITERLRPYIQRYFTERDYKAAAAAPGRNWSALIAEAAALHAQGADPSGKDAQLLLTRWTALTKAYSGGDAELEANSARMFEAAMNDPDAAKHPIPLSVWQFLKAIKQASSR